ncbi:MAG: PAS domain S-box protein [Burkholderiaceae bacterium]|jgi:PAS domain S-box-containing protein
MTSATVFDTDGPPRVLAETAELVAALAGGAAIAWVDDPRNRSEAASGLDGAEWPTARALAAATLAAGKPQAGGALVCVAASGLPAAGRFAGGIAAFHRTAGSARDDPAAIAMRPALDARLALLARGLAAQLADLPDQRRLQRLARHVPGVLYQFQLWPDGRMAMPFATDGLHDLFGVAPAAVEADASALFARALPDDLPHILATIEQSATTLTPWECEYRVARDGEVRWHQGYATPEQLADGSTLWHGFITSIDERKRAAQALSDSEERLRQFFDAGLVGMTIAEADRRWLQVNRRMADMLGYTPEEVARRDWTALTHPEDLPADEAHYARMLAGEIDGYVLDKRYLRRDGGVLECALAVRCERDAGGAVRRVFAIVQDISERRAAERALQTERDQLEAQVAARTAELVAARDAAEQASCAKSEFLASMSHELRTPLNAILGFGQLIELDRALGVRTQTHVREVLRAGRHLLRLINEVLDLAQVESGRLVISPEAIEVSALVAGAVALTTPLAEARRIALHTRLEPGLVVRADRTRLEQVLLNLLANAVKYNRVGGEVHVDATAVDVRRLRLAVRDTGSGIAAAKQAQLFQPFNRLGAENGAVEGTGIGLALSRRLVELMGGRIGVDSAPGVGSSFWVELPRGLMAAPPADAPAAADGASPALPAVTVAYVEDNPANLALVEQIVARHAGVRLVSAANGRAGLELIRRERPALVLLDIHLPEMDGYELLARLRADARTRDIPAVALTAQAMPSDARRAIEAGFDEYLAKPIDIPVFDNVLRRLLGSAG